MEQLIWPEIEILEGDIVVAKSERGINHPYFKSTNSGGELPFTLFKGRDYATYTDYLDWLKTRAFPENRCGAKELLEKMGLEFYNEIAIALKTNARMVHDNFSIRIINDETNAT